MSIDSLNFDPFGDIYAAALEGIKEAGFHRIHCSMTGVEVGITSDSAILDCIRVDAKGLKRLPDADALIDAYAIRFMIKSSRPAPVFQYIKSHRHLLDVMRVTDKGHNKILGYLAGRVFFDVLKHPTRKENASDYILARVQFLVDLQAKLGELQKNWFESLTADDEDLSAANSNLNEIFSSIKLVQGEDNILNESKAAQRCLESLARLDGMHELMTWHRHALGIDSSIMKRAEFFRTREWSFFELNEFLVVIEAKLRAFANKPLNYADRPDVNLRTLSLALHFLGEETKRIQELLERFSKITDFGGINKQNAEHIILQLRELGVDTEGVRASDRPRIEALVKRVKLHVFETEMKIKKVDSFRRHTSAAAAAKGGGGETQIVRGVQAIRDTLNSGLNISPTQRAMLDAAVQAKKIPAPKGTPTPSKAKTEAGKRRAELRQSIAIDFSKIDI